MVISVLISKDLCPEQENSRFSFQKTVAEVMQMVNALTTNAENIFSSPSLKSEISARNTKLLDIQDEPRYMFDRRRPQCSALSRRAGNSFFFINPQQTTHRFEFPALRDDGRL